jgi:hypothetical protein
MMRGALNGRCEADLIADLDPAFASVQTLNANRAIMTLPFYS